MGYTTEFSGELDIVPPLNETEVKYIQKLNDTRRMNRTNGPYFVGGTGMCGQGDDPDILDRNHPDPSQPCLWCNWTVSDDGTKLMWDGGEKAYYMAEWLDYIIKHFLCQTPIAKAVNEHFHFLEGHTLNGFIVAQGEEIGDVWQIGVFDNVVKTTEVIGLTAPNWKTVTFVQDQINPKSETLAIGLDPIDV